MKARLLLLTAAVALAGCAGAGRFETLQGPRRSVVAVANHNWSTAKLYLIPDDGARIRIATIETGSVERVFIPRTFDTSGHSVGFQVELIGSPLSYEIAPVMLSPGAEIRVSIENAVHLTSIMVMP